MIPANLAEALELAPLPYPIYPNMEQWDDFQPYSIAHLLLRSNGTMDERWGSNIQKRSVRGFASCDLWNLDKFFSYLVAYTAVLVNDEKVFPAIHENKVKVWCRRFTERVKKIDRTNSSGIVSHSTGVTKNELLEEFFTDILPSLPRSADTNYQPAVVNRNNGLSEQEYNVLGSHLIYVMSESMSFFFDEFSEEYHDELNSSINMLHEIEQGVIPTNEQVDTIVELIPSLWV